MEKLKRMSKTLPYFGQSIETEFSRQIFIKIVHNPYFQSPHGLLSFNILGNLVIFARCESTCCSQMYIDEQWILMHTWHTNMHYHDWSGGCGNNYHVRDYN